MQSELDFIAHVSRLLREVRGGGYQPSVRTMLEDKIQPGAAIERVTYTRRHIPRCVSYGWSAFCGGIKMAMVERWAEAFDVFEESASQFSQSRDHQELAWAVRDMVAELNSLPVSV
jgi:hypothetical protein